MKRNSLVLLSSICIILFLVIGCGKKEEHQTGQLTPKEKMQDDQSVLTIKPKSINYDSMLTIIAPLVDAIKNNPTDIEVRRQLVASSYDTTWETILAAGIGVPTQKAESEPVAIKQAERAAMVDAYRWAIYIKKWRSDLTMPDIGTIGADIQGGRVVAKRVLPDQRISVLVEIKTSNIP